MSLAFNGVKLRYNERKCPLPLGRACCRILERGFMPMTYQGCFSSQRSPDGGTSHCYSDGGISLYYPAVFPIVSRIDRSSDGFSYGFIDGGKGNAGRDRTVLAGWR